MIALLITIIYVSFISLGLPDSLLGAAWPTIQPEFGVPLSFAGIVSTVISAGTITSSLLSDRLTKRFGTGAVTAVSVAMTAAALFLFSIADRFWMLVVFAIPYGLGAGGVDASLNNYVALHLKARHMSWLHCMWGVGAAVSPYIMGYAITGGSGWHQGYFIVSVIQITLSVCLFISLPLWKKCAKKLSPAASAAPGGTESETQATPTEQTAQRPAAAPFREIFKIRGAVACFICFFCYCALESTTMLWASTYMIDFNGITAEKAAMFASLFFIGMTVGRGVNGFLTIRFSDKTLIRAGQTLILVGSIFVVVPNVPALTTVGFVTIGLGCAPVYPCIIHMTPELFGKDRSQAMIGVQMASAYIGTLVAPPLFGLIANNVTPKLLPLFLVAFLALMTVMHELVVKKTRAAAHVAISPIDDPKGENNEQDTDA